MARRREKAMAPAAMAARMPPGMGLEVEVEALLACMRSLLVVRSASAKKKMAYALTLPSTTT